VPGQHSGSRSEDEMQQARIRRRAAATFGSALVLYCAWCGCRRREGDVWVACSPEEARRSHTDDHASHGICTDCCIATRAQWEAVRVPARRLPARAPVIPAPLTLPAVLAA
jgi:hypothetical protein